MPFSLQLNQDDIAPMLSIAIAAFSFCCYWFLFSSTTIKKSWCKKCPGDMGIIRHLLFVKNAGLVILGVLPMMLFIWMVPSYNFKMLGLSFNAETIFDSFKWIFVLGILIFAVMSYGSRRAKTFENYPQVRVRSWDLSLMVRYSMSWGIYMLGYEMLFRGLLLFPLVERFGVWPAIVINTALYAVSHLPKGADETYAAMFFGPLLCLVTLHTETIWAASCIHTILAVCNSVVALKFHPEFIIVKKRKSAGLSNELFHATGTTILDTSIIK